MKRSKVGCAAAGVLGSMVMVMAALSGARYLSDLRQIRERLAQMGSRVIETDCGPVEVAVVGEGEPLLVIHGNGGGFDQGLGLAKGFIGEGFQVIAPSRFGYLGSPVPEGASPAMQADTYACLLDSLGIRRAAVFTSSAGVTSSVQFALRHPERVSAMIFHSPNAPDAVGLVPPPQPVFNALFHSDYVFWVLINYFGSSLHSLVGVPEGFALTPELSAEVQATLASILPPSDRADGILFDTYVSNPQINEYPLDQVTTPTLVISAVDDPMALHSGARILAEKIPNARLMALPDGGHLLLGHAQEVRAEIRRFLEQAMAADD